MSITLFENNILNFKYSLFDINRYTEEELYSVANLVSAVFLLDQEMNEEEVLNKSDQEEVDFMVSNLGKTLEKLEKKQQKEA